MAEPITVAVRRGGTVEARHVVHAVAVRDGAVVAEAGDGALLTFMRSSAKPIQALPLVRSRPDLEVRELAIASASHLADPQQVGAVRSLLAKAPAQEDELECGEEGDPPSRIRHNCSGKHAGFLALSRARGWDSRGYRLPEHPVQQTMLAEVAAAAEVAEREIPTAVDGCGVVNFALPLERIAYAFSRFASLEGGDRVAAAMRANPRLIRGPGAPDTVIMESLDGWIAKGGAEALLCAAGPDGTGIAVKVVDGGQRAVGPAAAAFLRRLGAPVDPLEEAPVVNSRGDVVGSIRAD
ncbi:MAG TPA: asparaginase [Gaiellaceae bacterium]|nr:asparaginase [Gaiellaceae bacterium]HEX2505814.1 asparaginase [Gaiellaceae bacterium]